MAAPAGSYTFSVYYRPRAFVVGAVISGLAFPLLVGAFAMLLGRERAPARLNEPAR